MAQPNYLLKITLPTLSDIQALTGQQIGQEAVAQDTQINYVFDGTNWLDTPLRKLSIKSATPNIVVGSGAGGGTATIQGNNVTGKISLSMGAGVTTGGDLFTITLADGVSFPNGMFIHTYPTNSTTPGILQYIYQSVSGTNSATIRSAGAGLAASAVYTFSYQITGY